MLLSDLLQVLREEFAQAADDIDQGLMAWLSGGAMAAPEQAGAIGQVLDRLAGTARLIALEGLALALEQLRDSAGALALLDDDSMGQGLGWLSAWRGPFEAAFANPGATEPADELLAYLAEGPLAPEPTVLDEWRSLLVLPPALPSDEHESALAAATEADVSLALPADVDHELLETFLADAPAQVARLGDAVRTLVRSGLSEAQINEAQRTAHTFKGSGSIIGIAGVARLAHRIEDLIEFAVREGGRLPTAMGQDLEQATATLDQMIYALRGEETAPQQALAQLQRLLGWVQAINDGTWAEGLAPAEAVEPLAEPDRAVAADQPAPSISTVSPTSTEPAENHLRVGVSRLDRLLRRAGQGLVQGGLLAEQWRQMDERLSALKRVNGELQTRLAELQRELERQGVTLQEKQDKASVEGAGFDPLELDRYNHVQTLSRFVAELVSDEAELMQGARAETQRATLALREHNGALKEQHRELLGARLVPFAHIVSRLRRTVSQTAATLQRAVRLSLHGEDAQLDSDLLERLTEPLLHLLRNAVDHGIEPPEERELYGKPAEGVITLSVKRDGQTVQLQCRDDGRGIDLAAVFARAVSLGLISSEAEPDEDTVARLILLPGFSTREQVTEVSGRGVGLDVVAERVRAMKGQVDIHSRPLEGTTITLRLPASGSALHALIVRCGSELLALPTDGVVRALAAGQGEWQDGRWLWAGQAHPLQPLAPLVGLPDSGLPANDRPMVLVKSGSTVQALLVDEVVDARELILQELGALLRRARGVAGGALRSDGRVMFVLDLPPLLTQPRHAAPATEIAAAAAMQALRERAQAQRRRVLVVDDAISVRKAVSQLLEDGGFEVLTARDGFDALQTLQREPVNAVLTDLEMPNLNGLELTEQLRRNERWTALPVVMITSRTTDKHRQAAMAAGVSHYLTKPYTDAALLTLVQQLVPAHAASSPSA